MCRTVPIFWNVSGWKICSRSAVGLQLQGPTPLLPLDELSQPLSTEVWLIPCREIYCTLPAWCWRKQSQMLSERRMSGQAVGAVLSFPKELWNWAPGHTMDLPSTPPLKSQGKSLKPSWVTGGCGALLCSCKRKHNTSTEFLWGHLRQSLFTV